MRRFKLDEYDKNIQGQIEAMGLVIVWVMFTQNRVLVLAREAK